MKNEKARRIFGRIIIIAVPLLLIAAGILLEPVAERLAAGFPRCPSRTLLGLWCPACGNTHAVLALLRLDIPESVSYNITPLVLIMVGAAFYTEAVLRRFGISTVIYPRKPWFTYTLLGVVLTYYILRNIFPFLLPA